MAETQTLTTEAAWRDWLNACAADLCAPEHGAALKRFGAFRYRVSLARLRNVRPTDPLSDAAHGWHLLEAHAATGRTRRGKRYKDWLFARADAAANWIQAMESGASLLLRDAVREQVRLEACPRFMVSLHAPLGGGGDAPSLEELLPGRVAPEDEIAEREWRELARAHAAEWTEDLDRPARVAIWARGEGLSLNDPRLTRVAAATPSRLYKAHRSAVSRLASRVQRRYPDESPAALVHLVRLILDAYHDRLGPELFPQSGGSGCIEEA